MGLNYVISIKKAPAETGRQQQRRSLKLDQLPNQQSQPRRPPHPSTHLTRLRRQAVL